MGATRPRAPARRTPARRAQVRRRRRLRRLLVVVPLALALALIGFAMLTYAFVRIPEPADIVRVQSAIVLDHEGRPIGRMHAEADRVDVPLEQVPLHLRRAVVAAEDRRFYSHRGVSIPDVLRAAITNLMRLEVRQGGSTITQQYVKNAFVGSERSAWRKVKEAVLALKLERRRSKDEILELYLNAIYFGRGAYGVEAAARTYFGKPARRLDLAESALLAGIIRAPEALDPQRNPSGARARRDRVLDSMASAGFVAAAQGAEAKRLAVTVRPRAGGFAAYFIEEVRRELERRLGAARLYRGGLRVRTTLDLDAQRAAERAVREVLDRPDDPDAALVAIDPATGAVRAMVGGRDFARRPFNLATRGRRQPGSAFKPFVLASALDGGASLRDRLRAPAEATFPTPAGPWRVRNFDRRDYGTLDLVGATERSVNTVYARLILRTGPERVAETARRAGIASRLEPVPSLALGTSPVSPLELVAAYATFAGRGIARPPYLIEEVTDASGSVLLEGRPEPARAMSADAAGCVTHALGRVVQNGTGRSAALGRPAAGKTGTTENHVDAWFVGFTPDLAAGVWMGYARGGRTMEDVRGIAVTGSSFPARIWRTFMAEALAGAPARPLPETSHCGTVSPAPSPVVMPKSSPSVAGAAPASPAPSPSAAASAPGSPSPGPSS